MKVHYNSRLASWLLPRHYLAITLGNHVFTRLERLEDRVLRHEKVHVQQWRRHGTLGFFVRYLWFHARFGYWRNPFELEARASEGTWPEERLTEGSARSVASTDTRAASREVKE